MWVCLNNAFISIVASDKDPSRFSVRARARGDLQRVFGDEIEVVCLDARDYAFRAFVPRDQVAAALAEQVAKIDYRNFKDSVKEKDRHDAYFRVWSAMADFQARRGHGQPYMTSRTGRGRKLSARSRWPSAYNGAPAYGSYDRGGYTDLFGAFDPDPEPVQRERSIHDLTDAEFEQLFGDRVEDESDGTRHIHGLVHPLDRPRPKRRSKRQRKRLAAKKRVT